MISRSCQDSRLHRPTDAFRSSKGLRMSTDSRITTSAKPDGKKCAFECWLPDNCTQTAVKFRSAAGVSPALSDMRSKRNRIHSCRFFMGSMKSNVDNWDANGDNTDTLTTRAQSMLRRMRSAGCGCPSTHTRFSVQSRGCSSRPLKTISSRASSSSFSTHSYCTFAGRDMHKYLTMQNTKYETTKPAARFSLFRTNSKQGIRPLRPNVDVWCSTLPCNCSREADNCAELQFNLHRKGRVCSSADALSVGCENNINTSIQKAIAHIVTESFQTGNDVGKEISMLESAAILPEELQALKVMHTQQVPSDVEHCWNKLWSNIPPSGVEENQSMVKLRQMAGKLIESLICKIKLQLDSGTQPSTEEHECITNEKTEHECMVNECQQHSHGTKEHAARSKRTENNCERIRDDTSESKHCSHQAVEKHVAKEEKSKAKDQGLHNPSEIQTKMAKSDRQLLLQKKSDDKMDLHSRSRSNKQENGLRSAQHSIKGVDNSVPNIHQTRTDVSWDSGHNKSHGNLSDEIKSNKSEDKDKRHTEHEITNAKSDEIRGASSSESGQSVTANNAADDEEGDEDNEEEDDEEEEIENDKLLQNGSHQIINEKIKSDMRVEGQQQGKSHQILLSNDYIEKTEMVKYRSVRPQPSSSEHSASPIRNEHEPQFEAENSSQKINASVGNNGVNKKDAEPTSSQSFLLSTVDLAETIEHVTMDPVNKAGNNSRNMKVPLGNNGMNKKNAKAMSSQSIFSNTLDLEDTIEQATMDPEAEATLKSFASEVVQSLYTAIRYKLKNLVQDGKDEAKKLEIMQKGDVELKDQILPTIIEHIVWIIKEEFRGQDESEWKHAMIHDPGQYLDTIVTNAVMKTHADHMAQRSFLKTFVVTSNFKHSAKWKL